jgi:hypothetical protein
VIACHACGAAISLEKIGMRDVCDRCSAYLHACKQCDFYEPGAHNDCRETNAELVADKEAGNFCEYFRVVPAAKRAKKSGGDARAALDRLFQKS